MPYGGGYQEQPLWWLEAIQVVKTAMRDAERDKKAKHTPPAFGENQTPSGIILPNRR